jgi:hypothetical protein
VFSLWAIDLGLFWQRRLSGGNAQPPDRLRSLPLRALAENSTIFHDQRHAVMFNRGAGHLRQARSRGTPRPFYSLF